MIATATMPTSTLTLPQPTSMSAQQTIEWADEHFGDGLVMSTSFGIQSAVTLHLVTQVRPNIPVIWVDTGYLPEQTYHYANDLTQRLNLNLHVARSPMSPALMERRYGRLWESDQLEDLNLYDQIRKVQPMQTALDELRATGWISGIRADQTDYRRNLNKVKQTENRTRVYPILDWSSRDVYYYMKQFALPQHPLFDEGYETVGDAHSSRPVNQWDTDARDSRFRGKKQECGLHIA